ncbi:MAG: peptide-methionine (S)-S-oxide reductase MsrA [Planctomycetota bacterium]
MSSRAIFGAGCFWGVESAYRALRPILDVEVGYAGGDRADPTYEAVCSGSTGHAEVVRVEFDAAQISYEQLLETFFESHDPTQMNRQGPDVGTQYRSLVLAMDEDQASAARSAIEEAERAGRFGGRPIVTDVLMYDGSGNARFWRAEEYHQRYFEKKGIESCRI